VSYAGEHELVEELFEQIKPGLSAYANDPRKVKCYFYRCDTVDWKVFFFGLLANGRFMTVSSATYLIFCQLLSSNPHWSC